MRKNITLFLEISSSANPRLEKTIGLNSIEKEKAILFSTGVDEVYVGKYKYKKIKDYNDSNPEEIVRDKSIKIAKDIQLFYRILVYRRCKFKY